MIECCGKEMMQAGDWYHCIVCGMRLRAHPYGKDQAIISEMVIEEVCENIMTCCEPKAPDVWKPR